MAQLKSSNDGVEEAAVRLLYSKEMSNAPSGPPADIFQGKYGDEIIVLSVSVVRSAQRLEADADIETADGVVKGRAGDFVITQSNGERYPILASVFYGTYQIIGRVGSRFVGRRLLHPRRAWPIESPHGELDYGLGRGKVAVPRGGWVYRSDEDDYGLINAEAKTIGHVEVGNAKSLERRNWKGIFRWAVRLLALLPPIMTMVALFAFRADHAVSRNLLEVEGGCLILGAAAVWWIRKDRWVLKAAVAEGMRFAVNFQSAAELLGQKRSDLFPGMALWRAAQTEESHVGFFSSQTLRQVKEQVYTTYEQVTEEMEAHHMEEKRAITLSWVSVIVVLCCIAYAWGTHDPYSELLAIWLPSAIGAIHASMWRRQIINRIGASREFLSELAFVRSQLMSLVPNDKLDDNNQHVEMLRETLKVLCLAAAEHTQRQLQFAIGEEPNVPV